MGVEFGNPILGGEELVRSAARSRNFRQDDDEGVTGWKLERDGTAYFSNLVVGNPNYTIDENGNAVFESVSANDINFAGFPLGDIFDRLPQGIIKQIQLTGTSPTYSGSPVEFARIIIPNIQTRQYQLDVFNLRIDKNTASPGPSWVAIEAYIAYNQLPNTSDALIGRWQDGQQEANSVSDDQVSFSTQFTFSDSLVGFDANISLFLVSQQNGVRMQYQDSGFFTSISRIVVSDQGRSPYLQSQDLDLSSGGGLTEYTKTYSATWSASWDVGDGKMGTNRAYQGQYSGGNIRYSKIGFDDAQIRSDLSGATILDVMVRLTNEHFWFNSGGTTRIGTHNNNGEPSGSSSTGGNFNRVQSNWLKGQTKWVDVPNAFGEEFRDDTTKGIALGRTGAGGLDDYAIFLGASSVDSKIPKLRIRYAK